MSIEIICEEIRCHNGVAMICQEHIDKQLEEAHKIGYDEGFEAGMKSVEPKE